MICDNHPAPTPDEAILDEDRMHNGINQEQFAASDDLEITNNTSNVTWESEELPPPPSPSMMEFNEDAPPPIPPKPADLYVDYDDEGYTPGTGEETLSSSQNDSRDYFPARDDIYYAGSESNSYPATEDPDYSHGILGKVFSRSFVRKQTQVWHLTTMYVLCCTPKGQHF